MDVSIILVSYNTKDLTRECLKSIYEKTTGLLFDIWIVDNASADNSVEMIQDEFPNVNVIASKENLGFGRANNLAISKINSKYVFLLNTDTILLNNSIKILFDFMEQPQRLNTGACGGQLYNPDMTYQISVGQFEVIDDLYKKALGIDFNKINHRYKYMFDKQFDNQKLYEKHNKVNFKEVDYIIGADLMLRKSVIDEIGSFDDRFFMFSEEAELQFRIKKAGHKIMFVPESKILHYGGASSYNSNKQLQVEQMLLTGSILFYKLCYGDEVAKKAKKLYIIYYLRYLILRFFSPKAFKRLKMALNLEI